MKENNLHTTSLEDKEILLRYHENGDKQLVGILYKRYAHLVMGLCMKYLQDEDEAKDMVVSIFVRLLDDLKKHKIEYFKSWLYTYSKNFCLMKIRSDKSKNEHLRQYSMDVKLFMEKSEEMHQNANKREQEYIALEKAMDELNEEQKICIRLFFMENKSYIEIASLTGYSLNNVKSFIQNGKRNLKIKLEKGNV